VNVAPPSVSKRIQGFLRAARPNAYCTACLTKSLGLAFLYEGDPEAIAREAVATLPASAVSRGKRDCVLCGQRKLVTSAR
jgi:hypothetical protein